MWDDEQIKNNITNQLMQIDGVDYAFVDAKRPHVIFIFCREHDCIDYFKLLGLEDALGFAVDSMIQLKVRAHQGRMPDELGFTGTLRLI